MLLFAVHELADQLAPVASLFQVQVQHGRKRPSFRHVLPKLPKDVKLDSVYELHGHLPSSATVLFETPRQEDVHGIVHEAKKVLSPDREVEYHRGVLYLLPRYPADGLLDRIRVRKGSTAVLHRCRQSVFGHLRFGLYHSDTVAEGESYGAARIVPMDGDLQVLGRFGRGSDVRC